MMAIWPAGPPNELNPSLSQKRNASPKVGAVLPCGNATGGSFIGAAGTGKARRSIQSRAAESRHQATLLSPTLLECDRGRCLRAVEIFHPPGRRREPSP